MSQLYREAIARGLGQAQQGLVIADEAIWIWNAVKDRFPDARQLRWRDHAAQGSTAATDWEEAERRTTGPASPAFACRSRGLSALLRR